MNNELKNAEKNAKNIAYIIRREDAHNSFECSPVQSKLFDMEQKNESLSNNYVIGAGYNKTGVDFMTNQPIYKQIPIDMSNDCILVGIYHGKVNEK